MTTDKRVAKRADASAPAASEPKLVLRPAVDIFENEHSINLVANLPGVAEDGLNLEIDDKTLTIRGEIAIDMPALPMPMPIRIWPRKIPASFTTIAIDSRPAANTNSPNAATRHAPYLSARAPNSGDDAPQTRFCTAMASEKI